VRNLPPAAEPPAAARGKETGVKRSAARLLQYSW
jgi:hypothetical protein